VETIAIFPLELVLLPGETAPLHIFEERYKRLMAALRSEGGEFGVVLAEHDKIHDTGCTAALAGVIEEFDDGRLNVLIEGRRRFTIVEVHAPDDPDTETLRRLCRSSTTAIGGRPRPGTRPWPRSRSWSRPWASRSRRYLKARCHSRFRLAAAVDFGTEVKQALLESVSETERLVQLAAVMKTLLPRVEAQLKRSEAIRATAKACDGCAEAQPSHAFAGGHRARHIYGTSTILPK